MIGLVELNKARVAEKARGDIKWLRHDFQIDRLRHKAPQSAAEQVEADIAVAEAVAEKVKWPSDGLDQIRAVRSALAAAGSPVSAAELNARFKGGRNRGARLTELLSLMAETGMIRSDGSAEDPRYFVPE